MAKSNCRAEKGAANDPSLARGFDVHPSPYYWCSSLLLVCKRKWEWRSWRVGTDDVRHFSFWAAAPERVHTSFRAESEDLDWRGEKRAREREKARGPIETRSRVGQPVMSSVWILGF